MKNQYLGYNSRNYVVDLTDILMHVKTSCRADVDPIWHEIAKVAARNGCHTNVYGGNYCGAEGVNFLHPTNKPKGYYNVLKWIGEFGPVRWSEIKRNFGVMPSMTLARLCAGCLLDHKDHLWSITDLGISYLRGAKLYLKNRK